ncbi:hypothetical protein VV208B2_18530 [Vibrio vulnificus]|nr:hypothetical protein VV208B2_18530 [Vibrio vulnificus]
MANNQWFSTNYLCIIAIGSDDEALYCHPAAITMGNGDEFTAGMPFGASDP